MGILRTWRCLNRACGQTFDSWEPNPSCTNCQCVRVDWQPAGGHIGSASRGADKELRALADVFKMTDMNSTDRDRGAKKVSLPPPQPASGPVHTFAGGFSAAINPAAGAQCVPTANKIDYRIKAEPGNRLGPGALGMPGVQAGTTIEASHRGGRT